jgi:hypothetical protein
LTIFFLSALPFKLNIYHTNVALKKNFLSLGKRKTFFLWGKEKLSFFGEKKNFLSLGKRKTFFLWGKEKLSFNPFCFNFL